MKIAQLFLMLSIVSSSLCVAQDIKHNYTVGPQTVTCDSLKLNESSLDISIESIRRTKFRFDQTFKLTRKSGLQRGEYYSCDNKSGFLIIKYNDSENLYQKVEKVIWNKLTSSADPEGYYLKIEQQLIKFP